MKAIVYARFSTERQSERSIEDQVEVCRRYIAEHGWTFVRSYEDRANLGAVTTMHVGLLGTMAQLYLSDLNERPGAGSWPCSTGSRQVAGLAAIVRSRATRACVGLTRRKPL